MTFGTKIPILFIPLFTIDHYNLLKKKKNSPEIVLFVKKKSRKKVTKEQIHSFWLIEVLIKNQTQSEYRSKNDDDDDAKW
jgi:hypothetical protein